MHTHPYIHVVIIIAYAYKVVFLVQLPVDMHGLRSAVGQSEDVVGYVVPPSLLDVLNCQSFIVDGLYLGVKS